MFVLIGLAIGAFLGVLAADYLAALDPLKATIRQGISTAREKGLQLIGAKVENPLISIGILLLMVLIVWWILSFSTAVILGLVLGVVYQKEIEQLPFVSGFVDNIRSKISGRLK